GVGGLCWEGTGGKGGDQNEFPGRRGGPCRERARTSSMLRRRQTDRGPLPRRLPRRASSAGPRVLAPPAPSDNWNIHYGRDTRAGATARAFASSVRERRQLPARRCPVGYFP